MKKGERKSRLSLTLAFAAIIFVFIIITVGLALLLLYILIATEVISANNISSISLLVLMYLTSLLLGGTIAALTSRFPLKPINNIITQMNRLASGDFKAKLEFKGPIGAHPAIKEITDSFNKMANELENTEMLRSDFINNFSHEFKTPIVSIAGFAKLLKRGNLTDGQRAEYIGIIEEESMRLSAMATNVLNMTKYENQTILTDITEFNLSEQIRSCILALEVKWAKKNIEFNLNFNEHNISANKDMLKHVWLNLIDNAVKFSPDNGTVDVNIRENGSNYEISVSNLGETIPPEALDRIFNKFYQADESHAAEGNGIGLALVKKAVELHKGKITVESFANITTFNVEIPKKV